MQGIDFKEKKAEETIIESIFPDGLLKKKLLDLK